MLENNIYYSVYYLILSRINNIDFVGVPKKKHHLIVSTPENKDREKQVCAKYDAIYFKKQEDVKNKCMFLFLVLLYKATWNKLLWCSSFDGFNLKIERAI